MKKTKTGLSRWIGGAHSYGRQPREPGLQSAEALQCRSLPQTGGDDSSREFLRRKRRGPGAPPKPARIRALLAVAMIAGWAEIHAASRSTGDSATFFMGRIRYSSNSGNDCSGVGRELIKLVSSVSTIRVKEEKRLKLTDDELFETPFVFMNGHNDFTLTDQEIDNLRKYFRHGGFYFASGCCTNPKFPIAWRREFSRILPGETVKRIPYDHLIYRSFYKIDRIPCLHVKKDIYLEGLFYQGRLVAVMCEEGLCCSFSMQNRCNKGKGVAAKDGQHLALNIAVYALTH